MKTEIFVNKLTETVDKNILQTLLTDYQKFTSNQKKQIDRLLQGKEGGKYYLSFLNQGATEKDRIARKKLCALLLARKTFGLPYDEEKVRKAIAGEQEDIETLRNTIYEIIRQTYDKNLDSACVEKISRKARDEKRRIVCGRFSRAFYIDALLLANAKLISSEKISPFVSEIRKSLNNITFDHSYVLSNLQYLRSLSAEKETSIAQINCGIKKLKDGLKDYEMRLIEKFEKDGDAQVLRNTRKILDDVRINIKTFEKNLHKTAGRPPIYMIFFQRLFPIDAIYMGLLNELRDPFFGEDPGIQKLLAGGGENIYVTPNMQDWLKKCDDWIEALPAYASYQIIPKNGSYKFKAYVQRNILEQMYRANAESWALNIENVMLTGNIAIAREIVAKILGISYSDEEDLLEKLEKQNAEVVCFSVLVEKTYENLVFEIAGILEKENIFRCDALKRIIWEDKTDKNTVGCFLQTYDAGKPIKPQFLRFTGKKKGLAETEKYAPLINRTKRNLPSAHILTTLGPGESEFNVKNWLEEGMLLFNLIRHFNLSKQVNTKIETWKTNLLKIGEKVIRENNLESEVYKLGGENKKTDGVLKTIFAYPEVGKEVVKIALLLAKEGKDINEKKFEPGEPETVEKLLKEKKPEILNRLRKGYLNEQDTETITRAREQCMRRYELTKEAGTFLRDRLDPTYAKLHAQKQVILEKGLLHELSNPLFRYEAAGPFKRYNLLYTPSRVDLGAKEVYSVRDIPKWVGGVDEFSAISGKNLYKLYNVAGPTVIPSTRIAEFLKVGENFFSRGGAYYLSLTASINLDALRIGDFEFFRDQWNIRGDRIVLPAGETYGGFCVPKEFSLLYSVIIACVDKESSSQILDSFGIPAKIQDEVIKDLRKVLSWKADYSSEIDWEAKTSEYLYTKYPVYFKLLGKPAAIARLPQIARTLEKMGILDVDNPQERDLQFRFTYWVNKKAQGLEEINRTGPFRKVKLIYDLVKEARQNNGKIVPDSELIGTMTASYKEGELEEGRLIPVADVRFSAGSRKLEIYSKTAEKHILLDIDPEGRAILKQMLKGFVPPADIRIVGSCAGSDILNHVPNSGLEEIKNEVEDYLLGIGLDENLIQTNCIVYGGDLKQWIGIRERSEKTKQTIIRQLSGKIHLLVIDKRGPFHSYEQAIQGTDFIDLGIPDPELLDLADNLPKMIYLMKKSRPFSALVFADGTSGARRPTFAFRYSNSREKAKELFALEINAVYGCLGIGKDLIKSWRSEMEEEKELSRQILQSILNENGRTTQQLIIKTRAGILAKDKVDRALREENQAKRLRVWQEKNGMVAETLLKLSLSPSAAGFDFGKWILLGGRYILNGKYSTEEISQLRKTFETRLRKITKSKAFANRYSEKEISFIQSSFVCPKYEHPKESQYREISTGLAGSLKAVEEKVTRLVRWEERKQEFNRIADLRKRAEGFESVNRKEIVRKSAEALRIGARKILDTGNIEISPDSFGKFLMLTNGYLHIINKELTASGENDLSPEIDKTLSPEGLSEQNYLSLVSKLAACAERKSLNSKFCGKITYGLELTDICFLLESISDCCNEDDYNRGIATFFDRTINSHVFDYFPYHYHKERSATFEKMNRNRKFELAEKHHRWLYTHIRYLITKKSALRHFSKEYLNLYLGNADGNIRAIGVGGQSKEEIFWFHYARLRDAVVLKYEGFGYPEIHKNVKPAILKVEERANIGIIFPYGNTTIPVALQQGPKLARESDINLILSAFPAVSREKGLNLLTITEGLFYPTAKNLRELRAKHKSIGEHKSGMVLATFDTPLIVHGIFFHFTHPMRPVIDFLKIPIIQPLIWEAATHLKCELPEMLKGSEVRTPEQKNWYMEDTSKLGDKAKDKIKSDIRKIAEEFDILIVKPEKESGGRKSLILPVREDNKLLNENIDNLADLTFEISKTDNAVIQNVLESRVRQLYTRDFLDSLVERFARIGVPVLLDREPETPLYSYFRLILVLGKKGYTVSHNITVVSTKGIANVGQGGLLYEYTDSIINPKYRQNMRQQITKAAFGSMQSQRTYLQKHWKEIISEYVKIYPEFTKQIKYKNIFSDLTGFRINDIPYEMGDYMPVFLVDENDNLVRIFDTETGKLLPLYDTNGKPTDLNVYDGAGKEIPKCGKQGQVMPIPLFDKKGKKRELFDKNGTKVPSLIVYKIEANPGAGLWRPHNDQLPEERKGEGVFTIFECFGERAKLYKQKLIS